MESQIKLASHQNSNFFFLHKKWKRLEKSKRIGKLKRKRRRNFLLRVLLILKAREIKCFHAFTFRTRWVSLFFRLNSLENTRKEGKLREKASWNKWFFNAWWKLVLQQTFKQLKERLNEKPKSAVWVNIIYVNARKTWQNFQ